MSAAQKLVLSPLDQHAPKVFTRMALVFPVTDYEPAIATLQSALEETCNQLPYLKGTVVEEGLSQRKQSFILLNQNSAAPQFLERPAPVGIPSYQQLETDRTPFPPEVFPSPMVPGSAASVEVPVLGASYTKIEGGLIMCIATYHKVVDGSGYSEILKLLAENARCGGGAAWIASGAGPDPNEISARRHRILGGKMNASTELKKLDLEALLARHPEYTLKSKIIANQMAGSIAVPTPAKGPNTGFALSAKNTNKVFAFSCSKIEAVRNVLKGKLPSEMLTVNNILTAIVWPSITHIRATRDEGRITDTVSKMDAPVSGRRLVGESLQKPPFVGNAIGYAQAEARVSDLTFAPSTEDAEKLIPIINVVGGASAGLTASTMDSLVELSDKNPDLSNITTSWLLNGPADVHFISWAQVAIYELDFGMTLGRPGFMRSAFMRLDGVATFLPRRRMGEKGEGDMDVSVLLREDDMERLSNDTAWQSWLA